MGKNIEKRKMLFGKSALELILKKYSPLLVEKTIYSMSIVTFKIYLNIATKTKINPTTQPLENRGFILPLAGPYLYIFFLYNTPGVGDFSTIFFKY